MIVTCGYCRVDSAGQHESNCPLYEAHKVYYPNGEALGEKPDDIVRSLADAYVEIQSFKDKLSKMTRERDLAIAHDTQPYPTAHAYEMVCKALHNTKDKLAVAEGAIKRFHPGDQVCDCINYHPYTNGVIGGFWSYDCDCRNQDDAGEAAAWCRQKNIYDELIVAIRVEDKDG